MTFYASEVSNLFLQTVILFVLVMAFYSTFDYYKAYVRKETKPIFVFEILMILSLTALLKVTVGKELAVAVSVAISLITFSVFNLYLGYQIRNRRRNVTKVQ